MQASPLTPWIDPQTQQPRSRWFWVGFGLVVVAQLVAFWLLCSQQVHKAEARESALSARRTALADCLQYVPGSTVASCNAALVSDAPVRQPAAQALAGGFTTVGFQTR
jgi:hypothetical protein